MQGTFFCANQKDVRENLSKVNYPDYLEALAFGAADDDYRLGFECEWDRAAATVYSVRR